MNRPGVGQQTLSCGSGQRVCCSDSQQQQQQLGSTDYDFSVFERHPGCLAPQVSQAQTTAGGRSGEQIKCILNQTRQDHTKTKTQIKQSPNKTHKGQAKSKVFSKSIPNNAITPDPWQVGAGVQRDLCVRPAAVRHTAQVPQAILVNMVVSMMMSMLMLTPPGTGGLSGGWRPGRRVPGSSPGPASSSTRSPPPQPTSFVVAKIITQPLQNNDFLGTCALVPDNFNNDLNRGTRKILTAAHNLKKIGASE